MPRQATLARFDVHCHLLPGVDDGCASLQESLACARILVQNGYRRIFCTPHVWPGFPDNTWANILRWTSELQARFREEGVPLELYPGGEINIQAMGTEARRWRRDQVPTLGVGGHYVLVDFWADRLPAEVEPALDHFRTLGLTTIMAHPERIDAFRNDPTLTERLARQGVVFQGNLQCFMDPPGSASRSLVEWFALEGLYFLLGSDCHRLDTLSVRMEGLRAADKLLGTARVDQLTRQHPLELLPAGAEAGDRP